MSTIEKALNRLKKTDGGETAQAPLLRPSSEPSKPQRRGRTLPPLHIDLDVLRRKGVYPPKAMEQVIRDQYRRIKRPLLANVSSNQQPAERNASIIMVTSAVAGEGKTFTSLNLALSIARDPDHSITLVDGDVARARISRLFDVQDQPGLLDLLENERLRPEDVIRPTDVPSLSVLPAGRQHELSEELLSSARMRKVLTAMADTSPNHIVLFDSPPLLAAPEAATLSAHMGLILMVVKASATPRHQVLAALDLMDRDTPVNMILNQTLGGPGSDDYAGYGSYYGEPGTGR